MPLPYNQNKKHIYSWREKNKEIFNKKNSNFMRFKRECIRMRNILIEIN